MRGSSDERGGSRGHDDRAAPGPAVSDRTRALAEAYDRHGAAVYNLARRIIGTAEAERITTEAFLALWRAPQNMRTGVAALRPVLLACAHRQAVQELRSDPDRRSRLAMMAAVAVVQESLDRAGPDANALLSKLSEGERSSIMLAYFGGHSVREIAAVLRQSESTVKRHIRTGMHRLRRKTTPTTSEGTRWGTIVASGSAVASERTARPRST